MANGNKQEKDIDKETLVEDVKEIDSLEVVINLISEIVEKDNHVESNNTKDVEDVEEAKIVDFFIN